MANNAFPSEEEKRKARDQVLGTAPHFGEQKGGALELLEHWAVDAVWGVWARPELDLRTRCIVTVVTLASLNRRDMLKVHMKAALRNGVSITELREIVLQHAVYAGIASGTDAMRVLASVVDEIESPK